MPHVEPAPTDSRFAGADRCRASEGVGQRWVDAPTWQQELASAVRDLDELLRLVGLPERSPLGGDGSGNRAFPLLVPRSFVRRIRPGDPHDPLLRQVLPSPREHQPELAGEGVVATGYRDDPVGDTAATVAAGLLQKYAGRALIVATGTCAVHCRYCFRQHFDYGELPRGGAAWEPTLRQIAADASLHEIIISGGDPLSWSDGRLAALVEPLVSIEHVRRVRIHTRLPIVVPSRVTDTLTALLADLPARVWMVVHANHAAELDASVAAALRRLAAAGVPLLNQAVLLRGVNDSVDALAELGERLVDVGVVPYYLHQLDRVRGAAHFDVPVREGVRLVRALSERLPGYAVPRYVQERAGASHKIDLLDTAGAHADRAAIAPDRY
ncbi:MAG: EF-P beta-lysylation protein EpmB [Pirellulales bacterium]